MNFKNRVERLEAAQHKGETPWWSLPPGVEPSWDRPLIDLSTEQIDGLRDRELQDYCDAMEEGREHHTTPQEHYILQEAFHEIRWRKYGIARRVSGLPEPPGWRESLDEMLAALQLDESSPLEARDGA